MTCLVAWAEALNQATEGACLPYRVDLRVLRAANRIARATSHSVSALSASPP